MRRGCRREDGAGLCLWGRGRTVASSVQCEWTQGPAGPRPGTSQTCPVSGVSHDFSSLRWGCAWVRRAFWGGDCWPSGCPVTLYSPLKPAACSVASPSCGVARCCPGCQRRWAQPLAPWDSSKAPSPSVRAASRGFPSGTVRGPGLSVRATGHTAPRSVGRSGLGGRGVSSLLLSLCSPRGFPHVPGSPSRDGRTAGS